MSGDRVKGPCPELGEDLVAYRRGEVEPSRREELERHVPDCPECRVFLADLRSVGEALDAVTIAPADDLARRVLARAKGLESAGPASRRLMRIRERERLPGALVRPWRKVFILAASAAACVGFLFVSSLWVTRNERSRVVEVTTDVEKSEFRALFVRWSERRECTMSRNGQLAGDEIDVAGLLPDGDVVLTGTVDPSEGEMCLLAFRASDWEDYRRRCSDHPAESERERFARMDSAKRLAKVSGGRLKVPEEFVPTYLRDGDLTILRLRDHTEIWSRKVLDEYRRRGVRRIPVHPA